MLHGLQKDVTAAQSEAMQNIYDEILLSDVAVREISDGQEPTYHLGMLHVILRQIEGWAKHQPEAASRVLDYYFNVVFSRGSAVVDRFLPTGQLDAAARQVLHQVIFAQYSKIPVAFVEENTAHRSLLASTIITLDEASNLIFPTQIHFRCHFHLAYPTLDPRTKAPTDAKTIDDWIEKVIRTFDSRMLRDRQSYGAGDMPLERIFQFLFAKGAQQLLPLSSSMSIELGVVMKDGNVVATLKQDKGQQREHFVLCSSLFVRFCVLLHMY